MASTYFLAIQDEFTRLRGTPFLLAATDFEISDTWRQAGIPLEVVLDTMRTVLEGRDRDRRRVRGLKFVDAAVWKAWSALGGSPAASEDQSGERLPRLAAAVRQAGLPEGDEISSRIEALRGSLTEQEESLQALDQLLLEAARRELGDNWRLNQKRRADKALARLRFRLAPEQFAAERRAWVDEAAREVLGLPRLSLFG